MVQLGRRAWRPGAGGRLTGRVRSRPGTGGYGQPEIPGVRLRPDYMEPEPNTVRRGPLLRGEHIYVTRTFTFPVPTPGESATTDLDAALEEFRTPAR